MNHSQFEREKFMCKTKCRLETVTCTTNDSQPDQARCTSPGSSNGCSTAAVRYFWCPTDVSWTWVPSYNFWKNRDNDKDQCYWNMSDSIELEIGKYLPINHCLAFCRKALKSSSLQSQASLRGSQPGCATEEGSLRPKSVRRGEIGGRETYGSHWRRGSSAAMVAWWADDIWLVQCQMHI